ncbi:hypothetical protein Taro_015746, partial [Colocasia esculenta]|nr:hypothetical protein [Colocasia esculenta]
MEKSLSSTLGCGAATPFGEPKAQGFQILLQVKTPLLFIGMGRGRMDLEVGCLRLDVWWTGDGVPPVGCLVDQRWGASGWVWTGGGGTSGWMFSGPEVGCLRLGLDRRHPVGDGPKAPKGGELHKGGKGLKGLKREREGPRPPPC